MYKAPKIKRLGKKDRRFKMGRPLIPTRSPLLEEQQGPGGEDSDEMAWNEEKVNECTPTLPNVLKILATVVVLLILVSICAMWMFQTAETNMGTDMEVWKQKDNGSLMSFALIACDNDGYENVITALKSFVLFSGKGTVLKIYLVAQGSPPAQFQTQLKDLMDGAALWNVEVNIQYYRDSQYDRVIPECSIHKYMTPDFLGTVRKVIILPADTILLTNIKELWNTFELMERHHMVAIHSKINISDVDRLKSFITTDNLAPEDSVLFLNFNNLWEHVLKGEIPKKLEVQILQAEKNLSGLYEHDEAIALFQVVLDEFMFQYSCETYFTMATCESGRGDKCFASKNSGIQLLGGMNMRQPNIHIGQASVAETLYRAFRDVNLKSRSSVLNLFSSLDVAMRTQTKKEEECASVLKATQIQRIVPYFNQTIRYALDHLKA